MIGDPGVNTGDDVRIMRRYDETVTWFTISNNSLVERQEMLADDLFRELPAVSA